MAETTYRWNEAVELPDGHRIFSVVGDGRWAIADQSGFFPHNTDDGVLWLDLSRPLEIGLDESFRPAREYVAIPVVDDQGQEFRCGASNMRTLLSLAQRFDWRISVHGDRSYRVS